MQQKRKQFVFLAMAAVFAGAAARADLPVVHVGTSAGYAPFTFKDKGKVTGFDVAVFEAVAKKAGYQVQWEVADFVGLFGLLESGRIDSIANQLSISEERKKKYQFPQPYVYSGDVIVVRRDNASVRSLDDLKGKTIGVGFGTAGERALRKLVEGKGITVRTFDEDPVAELNEVVLGRVDAYYNGSVPVAVAIAKAGLPLKVAGSAVNWDEVGFPFAKTPRGTELTRKFDAALSALKQDGTLARLSQQWLNVDATRRQ